MCESISLGSVLLIGESSPICMFGQGCPLSRQCPVESICYAFALATADDAACCHKLVWALAERLLLLEVGQKIPSP